MVQCPIRVKKKIILFALKFAKINYFHYNRIVKSCYEYISPLIELVSCASLFFRFFILFGQIESVYVFGRNLIGFRQ